MNFELSEPARFPWTLCCLEIPGAMEVVMVQLRFAEEFRQEAVRQLVERGHPVAEVAARRVTEERDILKKAAAYFAKEYR
jgi:hypothetical protein